MNAVAAPPTLADLAVDALVAEAELTPKPALVDRRGAGAHRDLSLSLLVHSAHALRATFRAAAAAAESAAIDARLRARLGEIGRGGEREMMLVTGGVNTHRGAIWSLGLAVAAASNSNSRNPADVAACAGKIACLGDVAGPPLGTNGARARAAFGVRGAIGEAQDGFPHVVGIALPALRGARGRGEAEDAARVAALLTIMATLDDTCLLHRGGSAALRVAQIGARRVLDAGGLETSRGMRAFVALEAELMKLRASPGGAADLLAVALFLDALEREV